MSVSCPICKESNFKNIDQYRMKPVGMSLCQTCGFITYPERIKSKEEILEYYRKEYRGKPPTFQNIVQGERKLQFHSVFLHDLFDEWKKAGREEIVVTDIGCAFGIFLKWVRDIFPKAEVEGVELTQSYVRNAWHMYRIRCSEDFNDSKKYDLITSYKSLEHIAQPDVELKRYIAALKDDGILYLGVPIWFEAAKNFGMSGFDLEYYYSPNHINTWHRSHVEGLIDAAGGEIVKEDRRMYDTVYLIKRKSEPAHNVDPVYYQKPEDIEENLKKLQAAAEAAELGQYGKAIEIWPNFPNSWNAYYEHNRKQFHDKGFDWIYAEILIKAIEACPEEADMHVLAADVCMRYDEFPTALDHLNEANQMRPNQHNIFSMMANCFREMAKRSKNDESKIKFLKEANKMEAAKRDLGIAYASEAITWSLWANAHMPTPFEEKRA